MFCKPKKLTSSHIKSHVSLSHIKARHGYDFPLCFTYEFLMSFRSAFKLTKLASSLCTDNSKDISRKNEANKANLACDIKIGYHGDCVK